MKQGEKGVELLMKVLDAMPSDEPLTPSGVLHAVPDGWAKFGGHWRQMESSHVDSIEFHEDGSVKKITYR